MNGMSDRLPEAEEQAAAGTTGTGATEEQPVTGPAGEQAAETAIVDAATEASAPVAALPPAEEHLRLAEALIFASAGPVGVRTLAQVLPVEADPGAVVTALKERYAGRGVELVEAGGGVMFRTALDIAPHLVKVVEVPRRLPRAAMEALAIIAYHQPVTRSEIEEIRGAALAQASMELLLENGLVTSKGRKETPGRPTMWGTTPAFLAQFGLTALTDLPKREELLVEPPSLLADGDAQPRPEDVGLELVEESAPEPPEDAAPFVAPGEKEPE